MKYQIIAVMIAIAISSIYAQAPVDAKRVLIYKNDACAHCAPYLGELLPVLEKLGYKDVKIIDFINNKTARADLANLQEKFGVPLQLQGHMVVNVEGKYLFEGHVPVDMIEDFVAGASEKDEGTVFIQDKMSGANQYAVWKDGKQETFDITEKYAGTEGKGGWGLLHPGESSLLVPAAIAIAPITLLAYYIVKKED